MKTSEHINELAEALSKAQGEIKDASMDSKNPHFKNEYASLDSMLKEIRPVFSKHGLSFVQFPETDVEKNITVLTTRLMHKSGQYLEGSLELILFKRDMQGIGAAITYARRYSIQSVAGVNQEKDEDGATGGNISAHSISQNRNQQSSQSSQKAPVKNEAPITQNEMKIFMEKAELAGYKGDALKEFVYDNFDLTTLKDMKVWQYTLALDIMSKLRGGK